MKNFKKLITVATIALTLQQTTTAYDKSADDAQPTHQGFGRFGTFFENTLTLHPGNAVNALATGDQSDTTFGWHEDEEGRIKANRARTEHNNNKFTSDELDDTINRDTQDDNKARQAGYRKNNDNQKRSSNQKRNSRQTTNQSDSHQGHWFWKKSSKNDDSSNS